MLKSMTGFGRHEIQNEDYTCKVEIRSVNARFLEANVRLPKSLSNLELPIKKQLKARCARGSFDVSLNVNRTNETDSAEIEVKPNLALAAQYYKAYAEIQVQLGVKGEIDINTLLSIKDMVKTEIATPDPSREDLMLKTVDEALSALITMREEEGANLQTDVLSRIDAIEKQAEFIKSRQFLMVTEYKSKLGERIKVLSEGVDLDESRLAQEAAVLAERCDVSEEITRLESHLQQFRNFAHSPEPMGRKLEFITQEINRETNTIGSKTIDSLVSQSVIEIKSDLEKIREQLQNIE